MRKCQNNIRKLALGFLNHESSKKSLPFGGSTYYWVGDPDAGYGREQPGGWCYNVFPFIEEQPLRELSGQTGRFVKQNAITKMMGTPVEAFICPTRRPVPAYPGGAALNGGTNWDARRQDRLCRRMAAPS